MSPSSSCLWLIRGLWCSGCRVQSKLLSLSLLPVSVAAMWAQCSKHDASLSARNTGWHLATLDDLGRDDSCSDLCPKGV